MLKHTYNGLYDDVYQPFYQTHKFSKIYGNFQASIFQAITQFHAANIEIEE